MLFFYRSYNYHFFPDAVFGDGNPDQKNCGSVFSSVDWDVRRNFTVRGSGRIRNEGKYSLCGRTISTVPFLCSGSSCAFALLLEQAFSNNMIKAVNPVIVKSEGENNRENMLQVSMYSCKYSFLISWESVSNATRQTVD